jgi:hypothetical protein
MTEHEGVPPADADEVRFLQLVAMFQVAAMQQMGKLMNPVTNEVERDLDQARASIDMLEMIKRRTDGNRTEQENELLDRALFELHMNYVEEVDRDAVDRKQDTEDGGAPEDPATEGADSEPSADSEE